jgi:transposase
MPKRNANRIELCKFFTAQGIDCNEKWPRAPLEAIWDMLDKSPFNKKAVEQMCERYGVEVHCSYFLILMRLEICPFQLLRLPPYHCHLNPIELFWAHLKALLREELQSNDKLAAVEAKVYQVFELAAKHCPKDYKHVIGLEQVLIKHKI